MTCEGEVLVADGLTCLQESGAVSSIDDDFAGEKTTSVVSYLSQYFYLSAQSLPLRAYHCLIEITSLSRKEHF